MAYTPPSGSAIAIDFTTPLIPLGFDLTSSSYTPPSGSALALDFTTPLITLDFNFGVAPPAYTPDLRYPCFSVRARGQIFKQWVFYIYRGEQRVRQYGKSGTINPTWTSYYQQKFAAGVKAWQNLSDSDKLKWQRIGVRKKEPLPGYNAFLSAWMKDKVT